MNSGSNVQFFLYWLPVLLAELFRKATKRQVMLGAALVDEKGNLRPDAATNSASLIMPSMLVPPPQTLFQFYRAEYHHMKTTGGVCHLGHVEWRTPLLRNLSSQPLMVVHVFPTKKLRGPSRWSCFASASECTADQRFTSVSSRILRSISAQKRCTCSTEDNDFYAQQHWHTGARVKHTVRYDTGFDASSVELCLPSVRRLSRYHLRLQ